MFVQEQMVPRVIIRNKPRKVRNCYLSPLICQQDFLIVNINWLHNIKAIIS
jgi:hypothetical protein